MNKQFKTMLLMAIFILNQICVIRSVPIDEYNKAISEDVMHSAEQPQNMKTVSRNFSNIEEMNVCIDICSECFKDDMSKTDINGFEQSPVLSCANECIGSNKPIKALMKWWSKNNFENNVSECLSNFALKNSS